MDVPTEELAAVAAEAARAGGDYVGETFRAGPVVAGSPADPTGEHAGTAEYLVDDVKTDVDREAERRVLAVVEEHFPDHATHGEETGERGDHRYTWVIDPLDGTNNFASALPLFATAVAVLDGDDAVAAAVYEPLPDTLYVGCRGEGAFVDGERIHAGSDVPLDRGTVSLVVGLPAVRDPALRGRAREIEHALEPACKRVLQTWAPTIDWGLVAQGATEGIVCFHPDVYEQAAGELLASEAGVERVSGAGLYVGAGDPETLEELLETLPEGVST